MNPFARGLVICITFISLTTQIGLSETADELLRRFDKNEDGQLDENEFTDALKALGLRIKTGAVAQRAERARTMLNAKAAAISSTLQNAPAPFDPTTQSKYLRRFRQARYLIDKDGRKQTTLERALLPHGETLEGLARLTTYERFLAERAFSDLSLAGVNSQNPPQPTSPLGPAKSFIENNFRLRDSAGDISGDRVSDNPAKFSWTHSHGQSSYYTVDAALLFTPAYLDKRWEELENGTGEPYLGWNFGWRIHAAGEAHVSTQEGASKNQLKYSALFQARDKFFPGGEENTRTESLPPEKLPFVSANYFELAPTYVTDRVAKVQTWGLDAKYEPAIPWLNLNHDVARPLFHLRWLEVKMQGDVGLTIRQYEEGKAVNGMRDAYGEFKGQFEADVTLLTKLKLTANYSAGAIAWGNMPSHDLFTGTAELLLDPKNYVTLGLTYSYGEDEPTFEKIDTVTAWVGVKF